MRPQIDHYTPMTTYDAVAGQLPWQLTNGPFLITSPLDIIDKHSLI